MSDLKVRPPVATQTLKLQESERFARELKLPRPKSTLFPPYLKKCKKTLAEHYTFWCNVVMNQLTDVLTAISHPTRRAIIEQLANGPARFLDVAKPFDTALNAVTKH